MVQIIDKVKGRFVSLYRRYGWKAVVGVFLYYLIRDVTLYIVLPLFVLSKI